jgi:pectate lyase
MIFVPTRVARGLAALVLVALPLAAHADSSSTDSAVGGAPTTSTLQEGGSTGGSGQTSSLLQPDANGTTPLQSADADSGGVDQSATTQNLQQSGASDQQKLLVEGEADGSPQSLSGSGVDITWLGYILIVLLVACVGTAGALGWQRRLTLAS